MLQTFMDMGSRHHMRIEEAQAFDQRPFRSMLIQQWIEFIPARGFRITQKGIDAWNEFQNTSIARKDPSRPLTRFFDPDAYDRKSVHVVSARRGAA
jgi:hypothetical protein